MRAHAVAVLLMLPAIAVHAEVKEAGPDHFLIQNTRTIHAPADKVYAAMVDIGHWWNGEHTFSGDAAHLSIQADAGGCFCERWDNRSVAHGRVMRATPGQMLRLDTALGPLQAMAVQGVMTFTLKPAAEGTALQFEYRVNGSSASGLEKMALPVDGVLMEQLGRLQRFVESGKADGRGK